ncbi:hypothetical protein BC943DRAFT_74244 [Umbelopsis sp. AD052]|nr:hypothetical protein BC943DRAFT_74244 [Umbelopsis sp. AD052]
MSRITNAFERMQLSLACPICHKALVNTRIVSECGHFSCQDCVLYEIGEKGRCPQCQLPAIVKNLQPYHTLHILSVCLQKLRSSTYNPNMKVASCSFADDEKHTTSDVELHPLDNM